MSCCKKEAKSKAANAACCDSKPEETKPAETEKMSNSNCGCGSKEWSSKKEEKEKATAADH